MLCQDFNGKLVLNHFDVRMPLYGFDQAVLNFCSRIIFMVKNAEFECPPSRCKSNSPFSFLSKSHPPLDKFFNLRRRFAHYFFYCFTVTDPVSCNHRVFNVFVEIIYQKVGDRRHPSLGEVRIGFFQPAFLQIRATLPLCATLSAKLIPAIPEPITRKSNFLTIVLLFLTAKLQK